MKSKTYGAAVIIVLICSFILYAHSTGMTGVTKKAGLNAGCTCHGGSPSSSVNVTINGPDQLSPGQTGTYNVTISGGPLSRAGTDIAVSSGTLTAGAGLQKIGDELTHQSPLAPSAGVVTFQFSYTAPNTEGQQTIYANGNSVNFNGQNTGDEWNFAADKVITISTASAVDDESAVLSYKLAQNYPNPFNPSTNITFSLAEAGNVNLTVYDINGKTVETLVNGYRNAGQHVVNFNAASLASGVYFYKLATAGFSETKKMILNR